MLNNLTLTSTVSTVPSALPDYHFAGNLDSFMDDVSLEHSSPVFPFTSLMTLYYLFILFCVKFWSLSKYIRQTISHPTYAGVVNSKWGMVQVTLIIIFFEQEIGSRLLQSIYISNWSYGALHVGEKHKSTGESRRLIFLSRKVRDLYEEDKTLCFFCSFVLTCYTVHCFISY